MDEAARILIADDEQTFLHSTADLLRKEGFQCDCVSTADEAVHSLTRQQYDLLIADILMPGNPNLEMVRGLAAGAGNLPVILVTGYPSLQSALDAVKLPVIAYLVKPFDFEELRSEVERAVGWSRLSRAVGSARSRLDHWKNELGGLEGVLVSDSKDAGGRSLDVFLGITLRNIVGSLADLERIAYASAGRRIAPEACQLLSCPRHERLINALSEAVITLQRTKSSFRSKELGELRRSLEAILADERKH